MKDFKSFLKGNVSITVSINDLKEVAEYFASEILAGLPQPEAKKEEKYLTAKEVMNLLQRDKTSLWRWKQDGILMPRKIGGRNYYLRSEIDKLMEG